ncbi:caspase family protein [Streptomyces sp. VNUA116]|uniref:caspase, EACC1-associated type n=1 Tax=Streptomyces sp. VNUA116 TaxID=3062449 RepID=UPI0026769DA3|nr:caspase family protein [Streptomyces sp. VNUA116]WKU44597.1 caspase family protein [Streptomyces sp. VNUA116]
MDEGAGGGLTGPDCHALVVGTGRHPDGAGLAGLPSAVRSATALAEALRTAGGMADDRGDRVTLITDPLAPSAVLSAVREVTDRAEGGVVLFCFVGHGLLGPAEQLYLATAATDSVQDTADAIPYAEIRNLLGDSSARPVVILDCCFSGLAEAVQRGPRRDPYVSARPDGSFLLASATHYAAAFAPEGEEHTLFTGELLRLLREGDAGGPKWFTLADLYRHLDRRLQSAPARPHSGSEGRIGDLVVAPNPRYAPAAEPGPEPPQSRGDCPYPGMRPFLPEQRHLFFGREAFTEALRERVTATGSGGPVVLVGPSGVGKSSLLRAGLGAALAGTAHGPVLLVPAPGARPFRTLTAAWADATGRPFGEVERELGAGRFGDPVDGRRPPRVLIVDQLEEIFTHCEDTEERELFVRALTGAKSPARPRIVLGLRADYFGHCLRDPRLARLVRNGQFTVPPMAGNELRAAVEKPAAHAGLAFEDGLADHLLRELKDEDAGPRGAIALPFLAHALQETWARRDGNRLTFAGYQATGGVRASVGNAAERIHDSLDDDGRRALRELLLRMVRLVDGDGRAVRRRVGAEELGDHAALLQRLTDARLVIVGDDGEAQLCHDSMLHAWPRLRDWINEDLDGLLVRRRLGDAADAWAEAGRPASGLYAGKHLAAARSLTAGDGHGPSPMRPVEQDFLAASGGAERRRKRLRRAGLAIVVVLAVLASTLAVLARGAQQRAEDRESVLLSKQLAAKAGELRERDPLTAYRLSLAAYRLASTPESRSSLYAAQVSRVPVDLKGTGDPVLHVAYSGDGRVLAASQRGGRVQLWDVSRPTAPRKAAALDLGSAAVIAFHPRTRLLAAQTAGGFAVWDTSDPQSPRRLAARGAPGGAASSLVFSPDGRTLAAGLEKGRLLLWDLADPARPELRTDRAVAEQDVVSVAFHHDGRLLAVSSGTLGGEDGSGGTGAIGLWDVRDPARPVLKDTATTGTATRVAFHPRRDVLAGASRKSELAGWTVEGGERLKSLAPAKSFAFWKFDDVPALGFSADGAALVWAGKRSSETEPSSNVLLRRVGDKDAALFDGLAEDPALPVSAPAQDVAWDPGGAYLAAGGEDGTVRLWPQRPPAPAAVGALPDPDTGTSPISHDGSLMVTVERRKGSPEATHRVWDVSRWGAPRLRYTVPRSWEVMNFLPGTLVLVAHKWTASTKEHVFRLLDMSGPGDPVPGGDIVLTAPDVNVGFSPDGRLLALGRAFDHRIELWDVSKPRTPVRRSAFEGSTRDWTSSIRFLTDRLVETQEEQGKVQLWDVSDPGRPRRAGVVTGFKAWGKLGFGAFRSRSLMLAEEPGRKVALWDLSDPDRPRRGGELPLGASGYQEIGDEVLAAVDRNNSLEFWDVKDLSHPRKIRTMPLDQVPKRADIIKGPDRSRILTGQDPYRIWDIGPGGEWRTPYFATLPPASRVLLFPERLPLIAVTSETDPVAGALTFLLHPDTDRLYADLCRTAPSSVPREDWKNLFSDVAYQKSC